MTTKLLQIMGFEGIPDIRMIRYLLLQFVNIAILTAFIAVFFYYFWKNYFNDYRNRFFIFLENNHIQKGKCIDFFFDIFFNFYAYRKPYF